MLEHVLQYQVPMFPTSVTPRNIVCFSVTHFPSLFSLYYNISPNAFKDLSGVCTLLYILWLSNVALFLIFVKTLSLSKTVGKFFPFANLFSISDANQVHGCLWKNNMTQSL